MITLSPLSRIPIYQQIIEQILAQIAAGILSPDTQMPGVRNLAKDLGINPNTVVKAYNELERDGFIFSKPGIGSFVSKSYQNNTILIQVKMDELRKELTLLKRLGVKKSSFDDLLATLYETEEDA